VLNKVVPVSRTTRTEVTGTSGETTTTTATTYVLVPGEKVEFQELVGHKVEVSGVMLPAGDIKTKTRTKIDREDAKDVKIKETSKEDNALPQLRVISVKHLDEKCQ
jgi:hypothetical protein